MMECTKGFYEELVNIEKGVRNFDLDDLYWYQDKVLKISCILSYLAYKENDESKLEELGGVHEKAYEVRRRINNRIIKLRKEMVKHEHDNND